MDDCCGLTRRRLLQPSSAAAAAGIAAPLLRAAPAGATTAPADLSVQDLELVTVTDTSFVLTWYTADAPPPAARLDQLAVQRGGSTGRPARHPVAVVGR